MMKRSSIALVLFALVFWAGPVAGQDLVELDGTPVDSRTRRAWASNWREFGRFAAVFEDGFIVVPFYDRRTPSSRGITVREAEVELTQTRRETVGNLTQTRSWIPPREESEAYANALPELTLGSYGYVHSVEVVQILGEDQMLVRNLWLIDSEALERAYNRDQATARASGERNYREALNAMYGQRLELNERQDEDEYEEVFRLVGYPTRGLQKGDRYAGAQGEGFQIAVVKWDLPVEEAEEEEEDGGSRGRRSSRRSSKKDDVRMVLVDPAPLMRRTVTEEQFIALLGSREQTIAGFVELVRDVRDKNREEADKLILTELLPPSPDDD